MRLRNTLLLAVVFILLGAYVYLFEFKKEQEEKSEKLLRFKEEKVESLILSTPEQEIRLKKEPSGKWQMTHPLEAAADESTVSSILSALNASEVQRTIEKKPSLEDLKTFGLDQPEVKVFITLQKGISLPPILVGGKSPVGNSAYVKRGTEPGVLLTSASLPSSLKKRLYDFRDKEILPFSRDLVTKLQIHTPKESLVVVKGEKEEWKVEAPKKGKAKEGVVADYLMTLAHLRAKGFVEDEAKDIKKYGLDRPTLKISLEAKDGKNLGTFLVGDKTKEDYYAKREGNPAVYTIEPFSYNQLDKQVADFLQEEKKESPAPSEPKK